MRLILNGYKLLSSYCRMDSQSRGDKIYVNSVEVPTLKVARAVGVDRRTVNETIRAMSIDREIKVIFSKLESCGPSLRAAAKGWGWESLR